MVVYLLDAHLLPGKDMTQVDLARLEAEAPAMRHREAEIVEGILEVVEPAIGAR